MTVIENARVHPTAIVEDDVTIGARSSIWDAVHIRRGARLGSDCIVGEKSYIAYDVHIGDRCKINAMVYICAGVTIETGVMIGAATTFTNDRFPRACTPDLSELLPSAPDESTEETRVCEGATIGANCTIGPGITIGRFAMVGMAAVVTRNVGEFQIVIGAPATLYGLVCRCGQLMRKMQSGEPYSGDLTCSRCERGYSVARNRVTERT